MSKSNPVKKVLVDTLKKVGKLYLHNGDPFTGYAFEFSDTGELSKVRRFDTGSDRGLATKFFADPNSHRVYDKSMAIDHEYSIGKRYLFDGKTFKGFSYIFDDTGNMVAEYTVDKDRLINRQWYANGQIKIDKSNSENLKTWYRNGQLNRHHIYSEDRLIYSSKYYRNGFLCYLYIADSDNIPTKIFHYDTVSDWFVLCGEGVSDEFIREWWAKKQNNISRLSLMRTSITPRGIANFNIDFLTRLDLSGNSNLLPNWVVEFESKNPNCTVVFNNTIVEHEPRMRLHMSALDNANNKFFFEGKEFSGIAYKVDEPKKIPRIVYCKDGEVIQNSRDVLARNQQILRVDRQFLKENTPHVNMGRPRYILGNSDFTGIAYVFDHNRLWKEEYYTPERNLYREWYPDGHIKLEKYRDVYYEWFITGQLHKYANGPRVEKYLREGFLYWLKLGEDDVVDNFYYERYELADVVHLVGKGINDEVVESIFHKRHQENVEEINIVSPNVSEDAYRTLEINYPQASIIKEDAGYYRLDLLDIKTYF